MIFTICDKCVSFGVDCDSLQTFEFTFALEIKEEDVFEKSYYDMLLVLSNFWLNEIK